jgi:hypothetical protein
VVCPFPRGRSQGRSRAPWRRGRLERASSAASLARTTCLLDDRASGIASPGRFSLLGRTGLMCWAARVWPDGRDRSRLRCKARVCSDRHEGTQRSPAPRRPSCEENRPAAATGGWRRQKSWRRQKRLRGRSTSVTCAALPASPRGDSDRMVRARMEKGGSRRASPPVAPLPP